MSHQNPWAPYSVPAGADLRALQYCALTIDGAGLAQLPAAGGLPDGILDNFPNTGEQARFFYGGILKLRAGAAIAINDLLVVGASGKFIKGVTTGHIIWAKALSTAAGADNFVTALVLPGNYGKVP